MTISRSAFAILFFAAVAECTEHLCVPKCAGIARAINASGDKCPTSRLSSRCVDEGGMLSCPPRDPPIKYNFCGDPPNRKLYKVTYPDRSECRCFVGDVEIIPPGINRPYSSRPPQLCSPANCDCAPDGVTVEEDTTCGGYNL